MKAWVCVLLILGLAMTGCAKKEEAPAAGRKGRQALVEGTVYLKQGNIVKAVERFADAIKEAPEVFEGYYMLGETFIHLKQYKQASAVMVKAVKQFPNMGLSYYLLAIAEKGQDNMLPAIVAAKRSMDLFQAAGDKEAFGRASILLAALVAEAKQESADKLVLEPVVNVEKDLEAVEVSVE